MAAEAFVARLVALEQGSQQLEQRTNELDQRISASVQAHTAVHGEQIQHAQTIQRLASDLANLGAQLNIVQHSVAAAQTGGSRTNRMIDPKTMAPERFGKPHGPHWKDWSYSVKDWVAIYHHGLRDALSAAEGSTNSIGDGDLTTFGVSADVDNDLKHLLIAKTEGDAREVVRGADQKPGLEQWRKLAEKYDPRGAGRNLADTLAVLQPGRAESLATLGAKIQEWENAERRQIQRGNGIRYPEDARVALLLGMCPVDVQRELEFRQDLYDTYEKMKSQILFITNTRTQGQTPMQLGNTQSCDMVEEVYEDENGELYRLETKDGKKTITKAPRGAGKGGGKGGKGGDRECYRCGRMGHIRADCRAKSHVKGGPPKE